MLDVLADARLERWRVVRVRPVHNTEKPALPNGIHLRDVPPDDLVNFAHYYSMAEIGEATGTSKQAVSKRLKLIASPVTIISPTKKRTNRIRRLVAEGYSREAIAKEMNMHQNALARYFKEHAAKYPHGMDPNT